MKVVMVVVMVVVELVLVVVGVRWGWGAVRYLAAVLPSVVRSPSINFPDITSIGGP